MNRSFTMDQLQQYNGLGKKPAYVAFEGRVYDVSEVFKNGEHYKVKAGSDITDVIRQGPHGLDVLSKVPVVGYLKTRSTIFQRVFEVSGSKSILLLRIALGIVFFAHGAQKLLGWFGGYGWEGTIGFFVKSFGISAPLAELSILIEFFGGLAIILGLLTRPAALALAVNVSVAMFKIHWGNGFFLQGANYGIEYVFTLFMIALYLIIKGAGIISLDKIIYELGK